MVIAHHAGFKVENMEETQLRSLVECFGVGVTIDSIDSALYI